MSIHAATLLEICAEGWANSSRIDQRATRRWHMSNTVRSTTTTWAISITSQEHQEVQQAFPHLSVPVGHFIVTRDDDGSTGVERFATEAALHKVWSA